MWRWNDLCWEPLFCHSRTYTINNTTETFNVGRDTLVTSRNLFQWACSINGNSEAWWQVGKLAYFIHNLLRHSFITKEDSEEVVCIWKRYPKYHQSLYFNCVGKCGIPRWKYAFISTKMNGLITGIPRCFLLNVYDSADYSARTKMAFINIAFLIMQHMYRSNCIKMIWA